MLYELIKFHNTLRRSGSSDWSFVYFAIWIGANIVGGCCLALLSRAFPEWDPRWGYLIFWISNGSYVPLVTLLNLAWRRWSGSLWYDEQQKKELEEAIAWRQKAFEKLMVKIEEKRFKEYQRTQAKMAKLAEGLGKTKPATITDPDF